MSDRAERVERVVTASTIAAWRRLLALDGLTGVGMLTVRGALLDPEPAGLLPCAEVTRLLIDLDEVIARRYGAGAGALPGSPLAVPDDPSELA